MWKTTSLASAIALCLAAPLWAEDLTIAIKAAVDNADPHQLYTPNRNVQLQVYEPLIYQDQYLKPQPWLATSWENVEPTVWLIHLREGVTFSDGQPFTAEDVVFSLERGLSVEGARTYRSYLKDIETVEAVDPLTVRITTKVPTSFLPENLTSIGMVSHLAAKDATGDDFNGGKAAVGTGPYKWLRWTPAQDVVLERNPNWWGEEAPAWDTVTYRFVPNDSARVAALLAGDVDVIDQVPGNFAEQIQARARLVEAPSVFTVYLAFDRMREVTPFATGADGKPLAENPFRNPKVLQAIDLAINRDGLAERIMKGGAVATNQYSPEGFSGHDPAIAPGEYDPARAKALLAEAGYPDGFNLTLHCYNDRFSGDVQTCQTLAAMFTAVGIRTTVDAMPASVLFRRGTGDENGSEFSAYMAGYATPTGSPMNFYVALLHTVDAAAGTGSNNRMKYSNPEIDALIAKAGATFDVAEREAVLQEIARLAVADVAMPNIMFLKSSWGIRADLTLEPRGDGFTMIRNIWPE